MAIKEAILIYNNREINLTVVMELLRNHGVNFTLLTEITNIAINNPDQTFMATDNIHIFPVSPIVLSRTKFKDKIQKAFKKLGIYNIILVKDKPGIFKFVAKTPLDNLLFFEIEKIKGLTIKQATAMALIYFFDKTTSLPKLPTNRSTALPSPNISPTMPVLMDDFYYQ